jgi:hypothetical protein
MLEYSIFVRFSSVLPTILELHQAEGQKWVSALPVDKLYRPIKKDKPTIFLSSIFWFAVYFLNQKSLVQKKNIKELQRFAKVAQV